MDAAACAPVVGSIPSDELETSLVRWIGQLRVGWSVAGLVTAALERRHYRRPALAAAAALVSIADAAWATSRSDRRNDLHGAIVGTAVSSATLVALSASVEPSDQYGGLVDWAFHAMLMTAGLTPFRTQRLEIGAAMTALPLVAYVVTVRARSADDSRLRPLANGVQFTAVFGTAAVLSRTLRRSGHAIVSAQTAALAEASRTAAEQARTAAVEELHSGAHSALLRTRDLLAHDRPAARRVAAAEAARLRNAVVARDRVDDGLVSTLVQLVERTALSGGHVDFVPDLDEEPGPRVAQAIGGATTTALEWLARDGAPVRCVLRVTRGEGAIELTVRQRDFAPSSTIDQLRSALQDALADVGGSVEISAPVTSGIRISMRVP